MARIYKIPLPFTLSFILILAKFMKATELNQLKAILSEPRKVVITTHKGPDGDAMGSSLALYNYLLKKGHSAPKERAYFLIIFESVLTTNLSNNFDFFAALIE